MCFTAEERAAYAPKLGLPADVSENDFRAKLLAEYDATAPAIASLSKVVGERDEATAQVAALSAAKAEADAEVLRLSAAVQDGERKVLELSGAAPKAPDAVMLSMYADNVKGIRERAIRDGAVTEAQAKGLDALLIDAAGNPTPLALSAAGPARRPMAFAVWEWVNDLSSDTTRTVNQVARGATPAEPPRYGTLDLSGAGGNAGGNPEAWAAAGREQGDSYRQAELRRRGLEPAK